MNATWKNTLLVDAKLETREGYSAKSARDGSVMAGMLIIVK